MRWNSGKVENLAIINTFNRVDVSQEAEISLSLGRGVYVLGLRLAFYAASGRDCVESIIP